MPSRDLSRELPILSETHVVPRSRGALDRAHRCAGWAAAGVLSIGSLLTAVGCASTAKPEEPRPAAVSPETGGERPAAYEAALAELEALAEREARQPSRTAQRAPRPTGLPASAVAPPESGSTAATRSVMSLQDAVAELRALPAPLGDDHDAPDEEAAADAMRLYVRGRASMLDEDYASAIRDLRAATRLDPRAPEPHRELAEAALRAGQQTLGVASMRRAIELGSRDPRLLLQMARIEQQQGRPDWAATLYQAAIEAELQDDDPGVQLLANAGLGELLIELGYDRAGAELLARSLELPSPVALRGSVVVPAVAELTRRLADLWRLAGDGFARSGAYEDAIASYERSASLPAIDPGALEPRMLHALMRLGRPSAAALLIVREIENDRGVTGAARVEAVRIIAEHGGPRRELARALRALAEAPDNGASVRESLALAEAAALPEREGAGVLDRALASHPDSVAMLRDRFRMEPRAESGVSVALRHARAHPDTAHAVAEALLDASSSSRELFARLEREQRRPEAALVLGYARAVLGEGARSYEPIAAAEPTGAMRASFDLAIAELAPRAGRDDDARDALERLRRDTSPDGQSRLVRALAATGDLDASLRLAISMINEKDARQPASRALIASEIATEANRPDVARSLLRRVLQTDPTNEAAHRALITLHAPGGPLADNARLADALRGLREHLPASPTARLLAARDLLERGLLVQAERALRELVELDRSVDALALLEQLWSRAASTDDDESLADAEAWLSERLELAPESATLAAARARVMLWQGRTDEAESFLAERIERRPHTALLRAREAVVREALQDARRADELALDRLARGPVTTSSRLERMVVLARLDRLEEAREAFAGLEASGLPRRDVEAAVATLLHAAMRPLEAAQVAGRPLDQDDLRAARAIFEVAATGGVALPRDLHTNHMAVESSIQPLDADRLIAAADRAVEVHPDLVGEAYVTVAARLAVAGKHDRAIAMAERVARTNPGVAIDALLQVAIAGDRAANGRVSFDAFSAALIVLHEAGLVPENEAQAAQIAGSLLQAAAETSGTELGQRAVDVVLRTGLDELFLPEEMQGRLSPEHRRAEMLFMLAGVASNAGRQAESEAYYREVIALQPDHVLALNNLAYGLAVRETSLDDAERLAERAYELDPKNIHVIDTLGWVRYKLGVITDEVDDDGRVTREGALTLIARAAELELPGESGIVLDQLADAQWVAGERETAVQTWTRARRASQQEIQRLRAARSDRQASEITDRMRQIDRKLAAARAGEPVPVSPTPAYDPEAGRR